MGSEHLSSVDASLTLLGKRPLKPFSCSEPLIHTFSPSPLLLSSSSLLVTPSPLICGEEEVAAAGAAAAAAAAAVAILREILREESKNGFFFLFLLAWKGTCKQKKKSKSRTEQ